MSGVAKKLLVKYNKKTPVFTNKVLFITKIVLVLTCVEKLQICVVSFRNKGYHTFYSERSYKHEKDYGKIRRLFRSIRFVRLHRHG